MHSLDRRTFLQRSSLVAGAALIAPSLAGLVACNEPTRLFDRNGIRQRAGRGGHALGGYGELEVCPNCPEISIPSGFNAIKLSEAGQMMSDGIPTPNAFDGMAAFGMPNGNVRLVRNHELRNTRNDPHRRVISDIRPYDAFAPAGNTTLEVALHSDGEAVLRQDFVTLSGTFVNCAGGLTPWGSWISCEETVAGRSDGWAENHGYNFEIAASANEPVEPVPLRDMGRFAHEAVAVDPATGFVYQTEDRNPGGFYCFIPNSPGILATGGALRLLAVRGHPRYDTRRGQQVGEVFEAEWVDIYHPDSDAPNLSNGFVFNQGLARGGAQFSRLEGCWYGEGGVYFNATSGGDAGAGQIWKYTPASRDAGKLVLVYESPSVGVLNSPDNICITPRGGIVICEDGDGTNYVRGITRHGRVFDFVRNNLNDLEWAGACFGPQGRTLFVNIQGSTNSAGAAKGMTFAIWGPWESGSL